jgi:hypothetical protein
MVIVEPIEINTDMNSKAAIYAEGIIDDHCISCTEFGKALNKGGCFCDKISNLIIEISKPEEGLFELDVVAAWMSMQKASREKTK